MPNEQAKRIVCLSNVYDQHYEQLRREPFESCLSAPKRRDLFKCWELATGREVTVISTPPRSTRRRRGRWLPALQTRFFSHRQFFAANWDFPKLRIPLSWIFFAWETLRRVRSGDLVVLDNFEFIHVVAAYFLRLFRRVDFILDYEDGKGLIERDWFLALAVVAEWAGRPLIRAALVANPGLAERLPKSLPVEWVPGFLVNGDVPVERQRTGTVRFLYSGSLDSTRGVDLLLEALPLLPDSGWRLDITGKGPLASQVSAAGQSGPSQGKVKFHGILSAADFRKLVAEADVGLNCQRMSDPISGVTFPSKLFSYLSDGLLVISSRACQADRVCPEACLFYEEESPGALAKAMRQAITDLAGLRQQLRIEQVFHRYSPEETAKRLRRLLDSARLL